MSYLSVSGDNIDLLISAQEMKFQTYMDFRKQIQENTIKLLQLAKIYCEEHKNFKPGVAIVKYNENNLITKDWEEIKITVTPRLPFEIVFTSVTCPAVSNKKFWTVYFIGISNVCLTGLSFSNLDKTNLFLLYINKAQNLLEVPTYVEKYREKISYLNDF